jgi:GNAT superfamily N-acetyltransferase
MKGPKTHEYIIIPKIAFVKYISIRKYHFKDHPQKNASERWIWQQWCDIINKKRERGISMIRLMNRQDKPVVLEMMRVFYASEAVLSNGSEEIFVSDIENCVNDSPYLEGYILEEKGEIQGYAMIAKSFSTEFGKPCIWIEDLYLKEPYRGMGIGSGFLSYIVEKYPGHLFRLEAERENARAIAVYEKCGFEVLPYLELKK